MFGMRKRLLHEGREVGMKESRSIGMTKRDVGRCWYERVTLV